MNFFDEHNRGYETAQPMVRGFMPQVFAWMFTGLMVSAGVAYYLSPLGNPAAFKSFMSGPWFFPLALVNLGIAFFYSARWKELSFGASVLCYVSYSAITGALLSPIVYIYTGASVLQTFLVAAGMFAVMALYGWATDADLSEYGNLAIMALVGLIIARFVNYFVQSESFDMLSAAIGVLIFTVLTAYDMQRLKYISQYGSHEPGMRSKTALIGALHLYLDLVNLFLMLLRLLGQRRR